jgi:hypothetical protein
MQKEFIKSVVRYCLGALLLSSAVAGDWVVYDGDKGPGRGKHIVLIGGDEEYRSEEGLPMLGKILAKRHGFKCTVLFPINPETGEIDPDNQVNIVGMENVADADLVIMLTRFRELPDSEMKYFVDYMEGGGPIIGLRTSTHGFNYSRNKNSPYANYSFNSREWKGGFGQQVLGDTWINHHGHHKKEATRGLLDGMNKNHVVLKGVTDIFGTSDVYGIRNLPDDADVLVHGATLTGMNPNDLPNLNKAMMPIAWVRTHQWPNGNLSRVFNTTMGASVDLKSEDLRRLIVNASFWTMEMENKIPEKANVDYVGEYKPTFYGFKGFTKGVKPSDHEL